MPIEDVEAPIFPLKALSLRLVKQIDAALTALQAKESYGYVRIEVKRGKPAHVIARCDDIVFNERADAS